MKGVYYGLVLQDGPLWRIFFICGGIFNLHNGYLSLHSELALVA